VLLLLLLLLAAAARSPPRDSSSSQMWRSMACGMAKIRLASCCSSRCTTARWQLCAAKAQARRASCRPPRPFAAPCLSSSWTQLAWPPPAARCSGELLVPSASPSGASPGPGPGPGPGGRRCGWAPCWSSALAPGVSILDIHFVTRTEAWHR
jgi:hypothetical protein